MLTAFIRFLMLLYRIGPTLYADNLNGEGPRIHGGRWNHIGTPCIYTSATRSLSLLEYSCHASLHLVPRALSFITYKVPDHSILSLELAALPGDWKKEPHPVSGRDIGTKYLQENKTLLIRIPSVVIEEEYNYIINPLHPDMNKVSILDIKDYSFDLRVKK